MRTGPSLTGLRGARLVPDGASDAMRCRKASMHDTLSTAITLPLPRSVSMRRPSQIQRSSSSTLLLSLGSWRTERAIVVTASKTLNE